MDTSFSKQLEFDPDDFEKTLAPQNEACCNQLGASGQAGAAICACGAGLVQAPKDSDKGPDFRVLVGNIEFGTGWKKTSQNGGLIWRRSAE